MKKSNRASGSKVRKLAAVTLAVPGLMALNAAADLNNTGSGDWDGPGAGGFGAYTVKGPSTVLLSSLYSNTSAAAIDIDWYWWHKNNGVLVSSNSGSELTTIKHQGTSYPRIASEVDDMQYTVENDGGNGGYADSWAYE